MRRRPRLLGGKSRRRTPRAMLGTTQTHSIVRHLAALGLIVSINGRQRPTAKVQRIRALLSRRQHAHEARGERGLHRRCPGAHRRPRDRGGIDPRRLVGRQAGGRQLPWRECAGAPVDGAPPAAAGRRPRGAVRRLARPDKLSAGLPARPAPDRRALPSLAVRPEPPPGVGFPWPALVTPRQEPESGKTGANGQGRGRASRPPPLRLPGSTP